MRSMHTQLSETSPRQPLAFRDIVLEIRPAAMAKARIFRLAAPRTTFGKHDACDIVIDDPFVSREHCALIVDDQRLHLEDCKSTNGTYVNGVRVERAILPSYGQFTIGKTAIIFSDRCALELPSGGAPQRNIIGESSAMRAIFSLVERVAASLATVLLSGESGTGKEVVARLLHQQSPRAERPFVTINCGALPATLIEGLLFGHERGAFTGAIEQTAGLFEQAEGGSLFLDEIGEMPLELQAKLLRVLEERKVRRLGGKRDIPIDVRIIAATHRDLPQLVEEKQFREDLFYRIFVVPIFLPPLRDRPDDIPLLAAAFLDQSSPGELRPRLTPQALMRLRQHRWSGNVRELKNTIERSLLISGKPLLDADDLHFLPTSLADSDVALIVAEKTTIQRALERRSGNQTQAARDLGVARTTLIAKLKRFDLR